MRREETRGEKVENEENREKGGILWEKGYGGWKG